MTNTMRDRFEHSIEDALSYDFTRDKDGDYIKPDTWEAFQGWQAAHADMLPGLERVANVLRMQEAVERLSCNPELHAYPLYTHTYKC